MISEDARERMRRAYYLEKKTLRQIAREEGFSRVTIQKAISDASPRTYTMIESHFCTPVFVIIARGWHISTRR